MSRVKAAHHRGDFGKRSAAVRASATDTSRCWRCGRLLEEHAAHNDGTPATWNAGHVRDGDSGSPLMLEASTCNQVAGAVLGNMRRATGYSWP